MKRFFLLMLVLVSNWTFAQSPNDSVGLPRSATQGLGDPPGSLNQPPVPGMHVDCKSLFHLGQMQGSSNLNQMTGGMFGVPFTNWTPEVVAYLKYMAEVCAANASGGGQRQGQQSTSIFGRATPSAQPQYVLDDIRREEDREKKAADEIYAVFAGKRVEKENQLAMQQCTASPQYRRFKVQEMVIADVEAFNSVKKLIAHEKRVTETTGVRDLYNERRYGEALIGVSDKMDQDFSEYKQRGGKAATAAAVTHELQNPCGPSAG